MNSINNFFDKLYVINLEHSVKRRESIISHLDSNGITNYEIFLATDKNNLNPDELKKEKLWAYPNNNFYCDVNCTCQGNGHQLSLGDIALNFSHYRIYQDIIQNNYEKCLILEDDCILTKEVLNFSEISMSIPTDWDLIYFGNSNLINHTNTSEINNPFFFKCFGLPCTHMYAITNSCAKKLEKNMFPIRAAIDGYLHRFVIQKEIIQNVYVCSKNLGLNGSVEKIFPQDY